MRPAGPVASRPRPARCSQLSARGFRRKSCQTERRFGAGEGNRTLVFSLEGYGQSLFDQRCFGEIAGSMDAPAKELPWRARSEGAREAGPLELGRPAWAGRTIARGSAQKAALRRGNPLARDG